MMLSTCLAASAPASDCVAASRWFALATAHASVGMVALADAALEVAAKYEASQCVWTAVHQYNVLLSTTEQSLRRVVGRDARVAQAVSL